jgi:uncharacterized protein YbjT (DUF2867 family)
MANVFVTGGTGYLGRPLIQRLAERGHAVRALVRATSLGKLPRFGCEPVLGDVLRPESYSGMIQRGETVVHLAGVSHPSPLKAREFERLDRCGLESVAVEASLRRAGHFVYVSVAQPAPVMRIYQAVRAECEGFLKAMGLRRTILRPWYVLGPGHWWPLALIPLYRLAERWPKTRAGALRLGLVSRAEMIAALVNAVENPPEESRVMEVTHIRAAVRSSTPITSAREVAAPSGT